MFAAAGNRVSANASPLRQDRFHVPQDEVSQSHVRLEYWQNLELRGDATSMLSGNPPSDRTGTAKSVHRLHDPEKRR
jgi:hypothetical protein